MHTKKSIKNVELPLFYQALKNTRVTSSTHCKRTLNPRRTLRFIAGARALRSPLARNTIAAMIYSLDPRDSGIPRKTGAGHPRINDARVTPTLARITELFSFPPTLPCPKKTPK